MRHRAVATQKTKKPAVIAAMIIQRRCDETPCGGARKTMRPLLGVELAV